MKNKIHLIMNEAPHIGSIQIGDAGIHSQATDYKLLGLKYAGILSELSKSENIDGTTPLLDLLTRLTREVTHTNDVYREVFDLGTRALFQRRGTYTDPVAVKSKELTWQMGVEIFESKIFNTTQLDMDFVRRNRINIIPEFEKAMKVVLSTYVNKIYPSLFYRAIFKLPEVAGSYEENFGLLRDVEVDPVMLVNYDATAPAGSKNSSIRNHYRAIAKPSTVAGKLGLLPSDIEDAKRFIYNYTGNEGKEIVAVTSSNIIQTLASFYNYAPTQDEFLAEGIKTIKIGGIHFLEADAVIPEDFIFFAVYDPIVETGHLLTKVVNPHEEYRGLSIATEDVNFSWDYIEDIDIKEMKLRVGDIGVYLTGRFRGLWLDCGNRPNTDGLMTQDGLDILNRRYVQQLAETNNLIVN